MSRRPLDLRQVVRLLVALAVVFGVVWRGVDPAAAGVLTAALNTLTKG